MWLKSMCSEVSPPPEHTDLSCPLLLPWGSLSMLCCRLFPVNGHKRPCSDLSDLFSGDWCSVALGLAALFAFWPLVLHWNMTAHWGVTEDVGSYQHFGHQLHFMFILRHGQNRFNILCVGSTWCHILGWPHGLFTTKTNITGTSCTPRVWLYRL